MVMIPGKHPYVLAVIYVISFLMVSRAEATLFFAKQYGLPCSKCHDKVPKLKVFGSTFKSNGFSFDKKPAAPVHITEPVPVAPTPPSPAATAPISENSTQPEPPSTPPPEKVDYLYTWRSADGTRNFTDNPLRAQENMKETSSGSRGTLSKISREKKTPARTQLSAKGARPKVRRQSAGSQAPVDVQETAVLPAPGVAKQPAMPPPPPPRSYEECMGDLLIKAKTPGSSAEAMEQFERAEQSCAPSAPGQ